MKYSYLVAALLLASCGTKPTDQATTTAPAATTDKPAPAAAPALPGKELDLTPYGVPVTMMVPDGTTATKKETGGATMKGPKFEVSVGPIPGEASKVAEMMGKTKAMMKSGKLDEVLVDEPTVLYAANKADAHSYTWVILLPDQKANKLYMMSMLMGVNMADATYTKADYDQMLAYARTAKITDK